MSDLAGTADMIAHVGGEDSYVRIQVPTNAGALDRGKHLAEVDRLTPSPPTSLVTRCLPAGHGCCSPRFRTGLGLGGHANTNEMLVAAAWTQGGLPRWPRSGAGNPLEGQ
jgi:hypothetical protein